MKYAPLRLYKALKALLSTSYQCALKCLSYLFKPAPSPQSIAILRNDAIGDYLLFRNFLAQIKQSYPNYHLTFIANISYADLSYALDSKVVDEFIFLSPAKFMGNILYALKMLKILRSKEYAMLLNPIHSRDKCNILLSYLICAKQKFAPQGDSINLPLKLKIKNDSIYTRLFPSSKRVMFEFYRNEEFFSQFLAKKLHTKLYIDPALLDYSLAESIKPPYIVLFIGASAEYRKWSIEHFAKVGIYVAKHYQYNIALCGGSEDKEAGLKLQTLLESALTHNEPKIHNFIGLSSLNQLGGIVYNGNLLVSNETSAAHLGSILDTAITIAVYNGNHLGRFIPYPKSLRDKPRPVFHHFIRDNPALYEELSNTFAYKSELDINQITPQEVIDTIAKVLL